MQFSWNTEYLSRTIWLHRTEGNILKNNFLLDFQFFISNFQPSPWAGAGELRHRKHVATAVAAERCCGRRSPVPDDVALRRQWSVAVRLAQRSQRHEHGYQHAEVSHAVPGVPRAQDNDTWVRRACYSWWGHWTVLPLCGLQVFWRRKYFFRLQFWLRGAANLNCGSGPGSE